MDGWGNVQSYPTKEIVAISKTLHGILYTINQL